MKISVIIPLYNTEKYIKQCIDSILNQTLSDFELIIVDDGSTDSSVRIVEDKAKEDKRIILLKQKNKGAGAARNSGLEVAKGDYLLFLDSDDFFDKNMFEKMYERASKDDLDMVIARSAEYNDKTGKFSNMNWAVKVDNLPKKKVFSSNDFRDKIFNSTIGWTWDKLFKSSFIKKNNILFQELRRNNDMAFTNIALCLSSRIGFIDEVFSFHRTNTNTSLQDTYKETPTDIFAALAFIKEDLIKRGVYENNKKSFINLALRQCISYYSKLIIENPAIGCSFAELIKQENEKYNFTKFGEEYFYQQTDYKILCKILKNIKVSIIVPVYNGEEYIEECLTSIMNQTLKEIEIIVVNDGSKDNTLKIVQRLKNQDSRIHIIDKINTGYGNSMNIGLDYASGQYIGIVESDDIISPNMYEKLYNCAKNNGFLDVVRADFYRFVGDKNNREFTLAKLYENENMYNKVIIPSNNIELFNITMMNWTGIHFRPFLDYYGIRHNETPGASYQDNGFWFQIFTRARTMWFINEPLYCVRRDNPNSSINSKAKVYCMCDEYEYIYNYLQRNPNLKSKYIKIYQLLKWRNYKYTYNRIDNQFKKEFIIRWGQELSESINKGELKKDFFNAELWYNINSIIDKSNRYNTLPTEKGYSYYKSLNPAYYKEELEEWFERKTKRTLNLANPMSLNEKIQWAKLYDSTWEKAQLSDKYLVKEWVKDKIGEKYIIKTLGAWSNPDEIDFDSLPNKFVIKCNHGSGFNIIVHNKNELDVEKTKIQLNKWLHTDFEYAYGLELHYKYVTPKIMIEEYFENGNQDLYDYKFSCFNGKVELIWVDTNRMTHHNRNFYSRNWEPLTEYSAELWPQAKQFPAVPKNGDELVKLAEKLSSDFPYVRVDFYQLNDGTIKFGEMTFTCGSGTDFIVPENVNYELGGKYSLPMHKNVNTTNPKVSVIIPIFNMERYIRETLTSVITQTLQDIEIICIDDGSWDHSKEIVQEFCEFDKRIKLLSQKNTGVSSARNLGIDTARGEFIAFVDADDWYPNKFVLEKMYNAAKYHNVLICGGSFNSVTNKIIKNKYDDPLFSKYIFKENAIIKYKDYQFDYGFHRFIYSRRFIQKHELTFDKRIWFEDPTFFVKAMALAGEFYALQEPTYYYRGDHKEIIWTTKKLCDLLDGINEDIVFSSHNVFKELHNLTVGRMEIEYKHAIMTHARYDRDYILILNKLLKINRNVNRLYLEDYCYSSNGDKVVDIIIANFIRNLVNNAHNNSGKPIPQNSGNLQDVKNRYEMEIASLKRSYSFRIGRFITYLPRKIRDFIRKLVKK